MPDVKLAVGLSVLFLPVFFLLTGPSQLRAQDVDRTPGLRKPADGCFVYLHTDDRPGVSSTFNSGIIVTEDGVVVIDALGSEPVARRVRQAVSTVTSKPVRFLISTTPHKPFRRMGTLFNNLIELSPVPG